jgi:hypothetical protein
MQSNFGYRHTCSCWYEFSDIASRRVPSTQLFKISCRISIDSRDMFRTRDKTKSNPSAAKQAHTLNTATRTGTGSSATGTDTTTRLAKSFSMPLLTARSMPPVPPVGRNAAAADKEARVSAPPPPPPPPPAPGAPP